MKILYVDGQVKNSVGREITQTLCRIGHEAWIYPAEPMVVTMLVDEQVRDLTAYVKEHQVDLVISLHFIMGAALSTYQLNMPYAAILWDAPYTEIYNPLGRLDHVWVTTFDRLDRERLLAGGIRHVLYQPLSVYPEDITEWSCEIQRSLEGHYIHDISFIGSLYASNLYDEHIREIPENLWPYFESIFQDAAFRWDGINRVYGKTGAEILRYIQMMNPAFEIPNNQDIDDVRYFEIYYLIRKIAHIERTAVLNLLAENHNVKFYTNSSSEQTALLQNVEIGPPVEYGKATSLVYAGSKINLNISLKGIEGGTPLRIMDIMGAGGFVLSSYCAETSELFVEDQEIVMFKTPEELLEKTDYYLEHDREREAIARAGREKVLNCYTHEKKLCRLLDWIVGER